MSSKFLLLFLSISLLAQSSLGKSLPSAEESTTLETELSRVLEQPGPKLLIYVLAEFSQLADSTLNTGKKLIQDVIADVSAKENKNKQITAKLEEYSKFLKNIEKLETNDDSNEFTDKFDLMIELSDLLDKSNATLIEKPTSTDMLFDDSLKKNGLSNLEEQFEEKFETFAKDFNKTAERILNSVTVEEWPEKTKIQDWLKDFKAENNAEKKIVMFEKFFEFFE